MFILWIMYALLVLVKHFFAVVFRGINLPLLCAHMHFWAGVMHGESPLRSGHAFAGSCVSNAGDWQDEH
jgi:hypothetical protein